MSKNHLSTNEQLFAGQFLMSNNRSHKAIFQDDGNFVIYNNGSRPVWASDTNGSGAVRVVMQADGNLVMYNQSNQAKWSTWSFIAGTSNVCRLELTDDGKMELTRSGKKVWSTRLG